MKRTWSRGPARLAAFSAALAAVVGLAACGSSGGSGGSGGKGGSGAALQIYSPLALSGAAASYGQAEQQGMEFAASQIAAQGYLGSTKISFKWGDIGTGTPAQAVNVVRSMTSAGAPVISGMTFSVQVPAVVPLTQQSSTPLVIVNASIDGVTKLGSDVFSVDVPQETYSNKLVSVLQQRKVKSTAIVYDNGDPAIQGIDSTFQKSLLPAGNIKLTANATASSSQADFSQVVSQVMATKPDAVGIIMLGDAGDTVMTELRQAGYKGVLWGDAGFAGGVATSAGAVANGLLFTSDIAPDSSVPSTLAFEKAFQAKYGKAPSQYDAQGYDAVWLIARAEKAAGCTSRSCLLKGLQTETASSQPAYQAALGPMTFVNREARTPGAVIEIENGKEVQIK
jgi:branched-chain amino acid transport system substrate-binding protein